MKTIKLGSFLLYDIDYIKRDSNGYPIRFKTSNEIKKELKTTWKH